MNSLRHYFHHSLSGYFYRRFRERLDSALKEKRPSEIDCHGVVLHIENLSPNMQSILRSGNYELPEISILPDLITSDDKILEVGAAIGFLGIYCRKVIKVRDLVSVEPNPGTLNYLLLNYELNGITPNVIQGALTATDGPVPFHVSEMFWCDSLINRVDTQNAREIIVDGLSFDSLVLRAGIQFNTLIIDIEGGEQYLPISSFPHHLKKVLIEIHPELIGVRPAFDVLEKLILSGFRIQAQFHNTWALKRD